MLAVPYDEVGKSKVSQDEKVSQYEPELSGTMKIRENAGEKSRQNKLEGFIQACMAFLPGIFRIFTGCFASCLAALGRCARKRLGERIVWISMLQRESRLFSSSISFRSLGPGLKALVQGRTADDRLRRIFHRR